MERVAGLLESAHRSGIALRQEANDNELFMVIRYFKKRNQSGHCQRPHPFLRVLQLVQDRIHIMHMRGLDDMHALCSL